MQIHQDKRVQCKLSCRFSILKLEMPNHRSQKIEDDKPKNHLIGVLGEKSLHAKLKEWYSQPGDRYEEVIDGFHIDIVGNRFLIEIQTQHFSSIKRKLKALIKESKLDISPENPA